MFMMTDLVFIWEYWKMSSYVAYDSTTWILFLFKFLGDVSNFAWFITKITTSGFLGAAYTWF